MNQFNTLDLPESIIDGIKRDLIEQGLEPTDDNINRYIELSLDKDVESGKAFKVYDKDGQAQYIYSTDQDQPTN